MQPLIVVVGATGNQGKSVVNALIRSNKWTVRGLTRNVSSNASQELIKQGVEMVSCNIDSVYECSAAFKGAYGIFAMTNYWECGPEKEYQQGLNMVNAAREQNVQHFIWSSLPDTVALSNGKLNLRHYMMKARVQSYIRSLDNPRCFPYITFVYIGFYYQNFETFFQPTKDFEFLLPLEETARLPLYDVRDTGNVVAQCFEHPERWGQSNIVPIVAQCLTMNEICEIMRRTTGNNQIRFIPLTYDQCSDKTEEFLDNMRWYNEYGNYEDRQEDKTKEVYNHMVTLEQWLKESKWLQQ